MASLLVEHGVQYTFEKKDAEELGLAAFSYTCSRQTKMGPPGLVFCFSRKDALELINHWNRIISDNWKYHLSSDYAY